MTIISTSFIGPGVQVATSAHFETIQQLVGTTVQSTTSEAVLVSHYDAAYLTSGDVIGATSGIRVIGTSADVRVGASGTVTTLSSNMADAAIYFQAAWFGSGGYFLNQGTSLAQWGTVLKIEIPDGIMVNEGVMQGATGVAITGPAFDIHMRNDGAILATGVEGMFGARYGSAFYSDAGETSLNNRAEGSIVAQGGGHAVFLDTGAWGAVVRTIGLIESTDNVAIFAAGVNGPDGVEVYLATPSVTTGAVAAIVLSDLDDLVDGSGTVNGDIFLNAGNDNMYSNGIITGDIYSGDGDDVVQASRLNGTFYGGDGNDDFKGSTVTSVSDSAYGGAGDDTMDLRHGDDFGYGGDGDDLLKGWNGDDVLFGGTGDDEIVGNLGGDRLVGGRGSDFIDGLTGNYDGATDTLIGGAGDDTLVAGKGDDILEGGGSDDVMHGGAGHDNLIGGAGEDVMTGAAGNDHFVFEQVADSAVGAHDKILDFTAGDDLLDLLSLGLSGFVGNGAFTGIGGGEVRYDVFGSITLLQIDADGDGIADMEIELQGGVGLLTSGDFLI
jgi:Ca2+-binding RTX toxin-like protein